MSSGLSKLACSMYPCFNSSSHSDVYETRLASGYWSWMLSIWVRGFIWIKTCLCVSSSQRLLSLKQKFLHDSAGSNNRLLCAHHILGSLYRHLLGWNSHSQLHNIDSPMQKNGSPESLGHRRHAIMLSAICAIKSVPLLRLGHPSKISKFWIWHSLLKSKIHLSHEMLIDPMSIAMDFGIQKHIQSLRMSLTELCST